MMFLTKIVGPVAQAPWFICAPPEPGLYERDYAELPEGGKVDFFDGAQWFYYDAARQAVDFSPAFDQSHRWRPLSVQEQMAQPEGLIDRLLRELGNWAAAVDSEGGRM